MRRREFIKYNVGALAAAAPLITTVSRVAFTDDAEGLVVNDVHSRLNRTIVADIARPETSSDLRHLIRGAAEGGRSISVAGARHAMGGQQFGSGTDLIDTRKMDRIIALDRSSRTVEVQSGITWPKLIGWLNRNAPDLSIIQKQTGADELTIGGALSANVHGRGLTLKPIIGDVVSFTIFMADGSRRTCSREQNPELFSLAIGGYGLFGLIDTVTLRLMDRVKVRRVVEVLMSDDVVAAVDDRIENGFLYGDFQYMTDPHSEDFMRRGVFSCYEPVDPDTPVTAGQRRLDLEDWKKLYLLAHVDKNKAYEAYRDFYLSTNGQIYWSDTHQYSTYSKDYDKELGREQGFINETSLMISELYVPRDSLASLLEHCRAAALARGMNIIYGTVRFIRRDDESFLPWAKDDYACVIVNLQVTHTQAGIDKAKADFQALIDLALALDGSYYLTYHRWARKDQVEAGYPRFRRFLELKKRYDPEELFQSDWYRHHKALFQG